MAKGLALLIGLTYRNSTSFPASLYFGAANNVMNVGKMKSLLSSLGFACTSLIDGGATKGSVVATLAQQCQQLEPGDLFVIYFAGHGFGVADGVPVDSIAIFDGLLSPDDLSPSWQLLDPEVRVFSIQDSCTSGDDEKAFRALFNRAEPASSRAEPNRSISAMLVPTPFWAPMIHFAAARRSEGTPGGLFTEGLLSAWGPSFKGSYREFFCEILRRFLLAFPGGTAQYLPLGPLTTDFEDQVPFTIATPTPSNPAIPVNAGIVRLSQCPAVP